MLGFDNSDSIAGTLDGVAGSFSCSTPEGCFFLNSVDTTAFVPFSDNIAFTPQGETQEVPIPSDASEPVPAADYLALGSWLYVPEDVTDADAYDFGVFASGGDPFDASNLAGLTGTATYEGVALGWYYVNGLSANPDLGSFTADVTLEADFGNSSDTGFISGDVNNFMFEGNMASSLPATLTLASRTYDYLPEGFGVPQDSTNIFGTPWRGGNDVWPGGHIGGVIEANVAGVDWYGQWHGAFYGNGASPTDHPTSVGGVFGTSTGNPNQSDSGLTGSFGAHRQ